MVTSIRKIEPVQADIVSKIVRQSFQKQAELLNIAEEEYPKFVAFEKSHGVIDAMEKGVSIYLLYADNKPVGTIRFNQERTHKDKGHINRLAVLPAYRGRNFGKMLIEFAEQELREMGVKIIEITIVKDFVKLEKYYVALGYRCTDNRKVAALPFEIRLMQKELD